MSTEGAPVLVRGSWRLLAFGLPALLAVFAANHLVHRIRQKRVAAAAEAGAPVIRSEGGLPGHSQIGIDESSLGRSGEVPFLRFAMLGQWEFDPRSPAAAPCPEDVRALDGREARCVGFMYPLEAGTRLSHFCLLRTTQTCCYGPRPQYNQYLLVELEEPVKFERLAPVAVTGRFFVDPRPDEGYIYRMEGTAVLSAAGDEPGVDGAGAAKKLGLPLFDFAQLAAAKGAANTAALPAGLRALAGRRVVVEGYMLDRREGPAPAVVLARDWWDGKAQGRTPTVYSAVKVRLRPGAGLPPGWKQKGVFAGTLRVTPDGADRLTEGVVSLDDAVRADAAQPASLEAGPILSPPVELFMLALFVLVAARRALPGHARPAIAGEGEAK